ncbi:hypothetical protein KUTeg_018847 [Tegillarca granosa]|uniref:Pseudouridine synthase RsuA/RluA-like domain-containing protein n=1 Tax=Tegillarca granosa TaxID=220873 RepID=A0ABQ9EAT2_TEGGR|nr:hypothetical protein KUTeg_018847 [Tegillarca granosa]
MQYDVQSTTRITSYNSYYFTATLRVQKPRFLETNLDNLKKKLVAMASKNEGESTVILEPKPTLSKRAKKRMERIEKAKRLRKQNKLTLKEGDVETDKDILNCTEYYYENGLRKVYPYYFDFSSYVKERWFGREILEVFASEFHSEPREYYKQAIENGSITVNGKVVSCDYKLKGNSMIVNKMHRHENPVIDAPIEIIADTQDFLVINKPSSIPCHPCGRSVQIRPSHLGVLIFAKNHKTATKFTKEIQKKNVQKEYVCRVDGRFPDGEVVCDQPIDVISHKLGVRKITCSSSGKDAKTTFQRLSIPHTGRTHQIRVHLQYLGYPIINDPFYNSEAFGPNRENIMKIHNVGLWVKGENPYFKKRIEELKTESEQSHKPLGVKFVVGDDLKSRSSHEAAECNNQVETNVNREEETILPKRQKLDTECEQNVSDNTDSQTDPRKKLDHPGFDLNKWIPDEKCDDCKTLFDEPGKKDLILYLHALKYKGADWEFSTPLPDWASEDWKEEDG